MMKKVFFGVLSVFIDFTSQAQEAKTRWVDSVFQTLNTQEKIGQLFMIPVSTYVDADKNEQLVNLIQSYKPGGLLITQGGPSSHVSLVNKLQELSPLPMLVGISAEWGLGQSMDSTLSFQKPLVLGAVGQDDLLFTLGGEIARQMKILGIHLNLAPHADFEEATPAYPVGLNYFGNDASRAASKAVTFMQGLQRGGVLAAAKHGHRYQLVADALRKRDQLPTDHFGEIDTLGLSVFKKLSENGVDAILTSHIHLTDQLSDDANRATELFVSDLLKAKLNFKGLVMGEIPHLQQLVGDQPDGEIEKLALLMGHDVLIGPANLGDALKKISRAIRRDKLLEARLNEAVLKILNAKYQAGLFDYQPANSDNLVSRLQAPTGLLLKHQLAEAAVTLLNNHNTTLPIALLEGKQFASISIGKSEINELTNYLDKYAYFKHYTLQNSNDTTSLKNNLAPVEVVVVGLFYDGSRISNAEISFLTQLTKTKQVIVCHFGDPYELNRLAKMPVLITAYTDQDWAPKITAQIIFGGLAAKGQLPVSVSSVWQAGDGLRTEALNRFAYTVPEAAGIDSKTLLQIDAIAREAIDSGATPGSTVLVAKDGKVIYERSYGWLTYQNQIPVTDKTIYDLASVTKVSATLQTVMFMHEKGLIDVNKKISVYLPELKNSNKKDFIIKDILTHQAGLWPYLPFWLETLKDGEILPAYYSNESNPDYPYPVADGLYATKAMKDSLWNWIIKAKIREKPPRTVYDYRYSDMGFYILQHLAEKMLNQPMEDFLEQNIYEPLGAYTLGYLPLQKFPAEQIAPTEDDKLFRKKLLTGYVHDQGAAMHGNIAGHAGLFGTANDLAKLGQMLLQKGNYGGQHYFKPETIDLFIDKQYETSRRGLGWDKPTPSDWAGPTTLFASGKTFGHTGFTGTCIWVDPEFNLVFVYLSNRVHPDMGNNKLLNANIRPRIQEVIYKAIFNYRQY